MAKYLLIESRDPYDSADSAYFSELAQSLAQRGNEITLFLLQNGVLPARRGAKANETLARLTGAKIEILADEFSLRERAIRDLADGVQAADMGRLVSLMLEPGTKAIWH